MSKHIYLVGAGGVGMLWIADYALRQGWQVSGSDVSDSAALQRLIQTGAVIHIGSDPSQIPEGVTEAVITAAATPSSPSFPEVQELERRGVPISKRAQWIGKLTKQHFTIAVAGAHGKTTTTAMIGWILDQAGLDPTVFVGGSLTAWGNATRIGSSQYLVIEADEYDRSFHNFYPQIAVVLNIDKDHTDYYTKGLPEIEQSYKRFLRNLPSGVHATSKGQGVLIGNAQDGRLRKIARGFKYTMRWQSTAEFYPGIHPTQPGKHVLFNASCAARVAHELGITQAVIQKALASFPGVGRRFEYMGKWNRAEWYDDYAHHPAEVAATLQAAREAWPKGGKTKLTAVFQPHQKARTQELLNEFAHCFDKDMPDHLILAPIFHVPGREVGIEIESSAIAQKMNHLYDKIRVEVAGDTAELQQLVTAAVGQEGILITMGAGDLRSLCSGWRD